MTYIFVSLLCFIALSITYWTFINGISPMPSSPLAKRLIIQLLPKDLPPKSKIYELGSGWGNLVFTLAKAYPNHLIIGYETSLIPYYVSKVILLLKKYPNVELKRQDFYSANLKDAGLIVCYLFPKAMQNLSLKFAKELKEGTYVLSHTFAIPKAIPNPKPIFTIKSVIDIEDIYHTKIYLYKRLKSEANDET